MKTVTALTIDKIMIEAIQNQYSVYAWKSLNGEVEKCELKIKAFRKELGEVELEIPTNENKKIADIVTGAREIHFYLPESSVSFNAKIKVTLDEKKIKIYIPTEYSFYERRKNERVNLEKCFLTFEHNKNKIRKSIFDIGMGGIALVLPRTEKIMAKKGLTFENCILEVETRKIKLSIECVGTQAIDRYKLESLPYGGNKFSFRFVNLSKEDKDFLQDLITHKILQSKRLKGA